jgi:fatty acid desaturase
VLSTLALFRGRLGGARLVGDPSLGNRALPARRPATAGLFVRLFIFQHDCGHGSFLGKTAA